MRQRGLLDRIAATTVSGTRPIDTFTSVCANLTAVLNARQGGAATRVDFGVPDFTDRMHALPQGTMELCEELRAVIASFEPRLTHVQVRPSADQALGTTLRFAVSARLVDASSKRVVRFETQFRPGGQVVVE